MVVACIAISLVLVGDTVFSASQKEAPCGVEFRILADKKAYAPRSTARIKFIVTNTGKSPLYFFRGMSECSSQLGIFSLVLFDKEQHEINSFGCSVEVALNQMNLEQELTSSDSGIKLGPKQIFGIETEVELPANRGVYRLEARLVPSALTKDHRATLSDKGLKLLAESCRAPVVLIEIK